MPLNLTGSTLTTNSPNYTYTVNEYPKGLGSERYPHFVVFFVNANSQSETAKVPANIQYIIGSSGHTVNSTNVGAITTVNNITNQLGITPASTTSTPVEVGRSYRRLRSAIALHIPHQIQASYDAQYETIEANMLGKAILGASDDIKNMAANGKLTTMEALKAALLGSAPETLARGTAGGIAGLAINGDTGAAIGGLTGKVDNPRAENLFKQVGFRQHQFHYTFTPTSKEESESVEKIIKKFKVHMHPEIQTNETAGTAGSTTKNSFLITPDVFDIEFFYKDRQNINISKIATCVLENMTVDYTGTGNWVAFSGTGQPVCINMTLNFKEVEPLVRKMIEEGY